MICLLSLILPFDPLHQPSTTTSITAMATGDTPGSMKPGDMIVSVTRHKNSIKEQAGFADLNKMLEARLAVSLDDLSIVWCLAESGQLAVVNDRDSLTAAIRDHQSAVKHAVLLYVVKNSGKIKTKTEDDRSDS
jgi:hypothetical protein